MYCASCGKELATAVGFVLLDCVSGFLEPTVYRDLES